MDRGARRRGSASTSRGAPMSVRWEGGVRQRGFLGVAWGGGFFFPGEVSAAAIFQWGSFTHRDAIYVWAVLAGWAGGMLAARMGRLYNWAFYALEDTRTPLKF